jgi:L-2-hydroxyglutarate oxidase LhgO
VKASLCVSGKVLLYDYCSTHGVPCNNIGKIVVAVTPDEVQR